MAILKVRGQRMVRMTEVGDKNRTPKVPELFTHWYDFLNWLLDRTTRFPKNLRHTLTNRIETLVLNILMNIVEARYDRKNRSDRLSSINLDLEKMRVLMRLCHSRRLLSKNQYEHASREIDKAGRMTGGWKRFQENRDETSGEPV